MRLAAALLALMVASCGPSPKEAVEKAVSERLIDPTSPLFRGVMQCSADNRVWSGEVNGKNRLGAYVGYEPFFYAPDDFALGYDDYRIMPLMKRCYGSAMASDPSTNEDAATEPGPEPTETLTPNSIDNGAASDAGPRAEASDPNPCEGQDYMC